MDNKNQIVNVLLGAVCDGYCMDSRSELEELACYLSKKMAPVVHGKWEDADDGDGVVCSVCGEDFCTLYLKTERFYFCPNCGADMRGDNHG